MNSNVNWLWLALAIVVILYNMSAALHGHVGAWISIAFGGLIIYSVWHPLALGIRFKRFTRKFLK